MHAFNWMRPGSTGLVFGSIASAQLLSTGLSVTLNGLFYYISPYASGTLAIAPGPLDHVPGVHGFKPVTVVQEVVTQAALSSLVANWKSADDVFQTGFSHVLLVAGGGSSYTTQSVLDGNLSTQVIPCNVTSVPSGPYFLETATGALHPVYRLYDDFAGAFTETLLQKTDGTFQPLSARIAGTASLTVGVPSRLYYTKTAAKPLAGVRVGVKDIYRLAGVRSSMGNRAWYNLYPANTVTAPAIQRLIDAGAQIVGLQKASQFANGEWATADWVDYHAPFNPRGDGYQDPSSSSSGAGASIASYPWLDLAIGTDTGGSIRGPAQAQGVFGNRPSHGLVALDQVLPLSPAFDTAGFLTRDPVLWDEANAVLYKGSYSSLADVTAPIDYPTTIHTIGFPASANESDAAAILLSFLAALADFVGGEASSLDLETAWAESAPFATHNQTLTVMLNTTYATLISKNQAALVRDPFYVDYAAANDNRTPFIDPAPLDRWAYGDTQPASAVTDALANKTLFMNWFSSAILSPVPNISCSSALLLYVGNDGSQVARDEYFDGPAAPFGFAVDRIGPLAEVPDSVFPIGEVGSFSVISGHNEFFPVAVDVVAAKGCDGMLARLARDLVERGVIKVPETGGSLVGGKIPMR